MSGKIWNDQFEKQVLFLFDDTNHISQRLTEIERKIEKYNDFEIFHPILSSLYNNAFLLMLELKIFTFLNMPKNLEIYSS